MTPDDDLKRWGEPPASDAELHWAQRMGEAMERGGPAEVMEAEGLVSAPNAGKREVLVSKDYFEEVDAQLR